MNKETTVIRTVGEMVDALAEFNRDMPIKGTWEGVVRDIRIYIGADCNRWAKEIIWTRTIMIDCDGGHYRKLNQEHING